MSSSMDVNVTNNYLIAAAILILGAAHIAGSTIRKTRRWKTRPLYATRFKNGFYRSTFLQMKANDPDQFFKYTRMSVEVFDLFCNQLKKTLLKRRISDQICPEEKIAITLQQVVLFFCELKFIVDIFLVGICHKVLVCKA